MLVSQLPTSGEGSWAKLGKPGVQRRKLGTLCLAFALLCEELRPFCPRSVLSAVARALAVLSGLRVSRVLLARGHADVPLQC